MTKALLHTALVCGLLALPFAAMAEEVGQTVAVEKVPAPALVAPAAVTDDLRFSMDDWGKIFLDMHEVGPRVLARDFEVSLPPFFANTSADTKAELALLKKFEAEERREDRVKTIRAEHSVMPLYRLFADNGFYDFEKAPLTNSLLASVDRDVTYFIMDQKLRWQRPRPTQLDATLTTVVPVPGHASYPSGHAGQSYAYALTLAKIDPARAAEYKALAVQIAHRREVAGVHYPSDSVAGRLLAEQVVEAMFKDAEIQKRLELAKKEYATAR